MFVCLQFVKSNERLAREIKTCYWCWSLAVLFHVNFNINKILHTKTTDYKALNWYEGICSGEVAVSSNDPSWSFEYKHKMTWQPINITDTNMRNIFITGTLGTQTLSDQVFLLSSIFSSASLNPPIMRSYLSHPNRRMWTYQSNCRIDLLLYRFICLTSLLLLSIFLSAWSISLVSWGSAEADVHPLLMYSPLPLSEA